MLRKIIEIDEEKCDGCGLCIPECHEGALQLIDGKARLISDLFCDGLGACIGHCPQGAIRIVEREAQPYDERLVMKNMVRQGRNTIIAHLKHLNDHNETGLLEQAWNYLEEQGIDIPRTVLAETFPEPQAGPACPGSKSMDFDILEREAAPAEVPSALTHWPVQFHLISPLAPQYQNADLLLAADCVAYALGNFHQHYLPGKKLVIACPKLDSNQPVYLEKLKSLINEAQINSITVMIMQVPCCSGLVQLVQAAMEKSSRQIPVTGIVVGVDGQILKEVDLQIP